MTAIACFPHLTSDLPVTRPESGLASISLANGLARSNHPVRSFLQPRCKVRDHSQGLTDLLRHSVQKNFLAVGRHVIKGHARDGPITDQRLWCTKLQGTAGWVYRHRKKIKGRSK